VSDAVAPDSSGTEPLNCLLEAWRGEVEAHAVYAALAGRERDAKRAAVLRACPRRRRAIGGEFEARLRKLGAAVPDPGRVGLALGQSFRSDSLGREGACLAERLEDRESEGIYRQATGDSETDQLFGESR